MSSVVAVCKSNKHSSWYQECGCAIPRPLMELEREQLGSEDSQRVVDSWGRLLRKYLGIRRIQQIFAACGAALRDQNRQALNRTSRVFSKQ
jgi:hypothetical protein